MFFFIIRTCQKMCVFLFTFLSFFFVNEYGGGQYLGAFFLLKGLPDSVIPLPADPQYHQARVVDKRPFSFFLLWDMVYNWFPFCFVFFCSESP